MARLSAAGLLGLVLGWAVVPLVYPRETAKARAAASVYLGRLPLDTPEFQQFQRYFALAGQVLLAYGIFRGITLLVTELWCAGPISAIQALYRSVKEVSCTSGFPGHEADLSKRAVKLFLILPPVAKKVDSELAEVRAELVAKWSPAAYPDGVQITQVRSLPAQGRSRDWLQAEFNGMKALEKGDVGSGRVSGTVYHVSALRECMLVAHKAGRRRAQPGNQGRHVCLSAQQPPSCGRVPWGEKDGERDCQHVLEPVSHS